MADIDLGGQCSCIIDSNVLLDLYSIHDLVVARAQAIATHAGDVDAAHDSKDMVYRRIRAADALALAIALHDTKATTFQLANESLRKMEEYVPPDDVTDELAFTLLFLHYVRDFCLGDWKAVTDKAADENLIGNACDDLLVETARRNALPLVSVEGLHADGIDNKKRLRRRAKAAGVEVLTPVEYVARLGVVFPAASKAFAGRFHTRQDEYLASFPADRRDGIRGDIAAIGNVYQWCSVATKWRPTLPAPPASH